jgi:hypothetical protein
LVNVTSQGNPEQRLSTTQRLLAAALAVVLIAPVIVAGTLQPDPRGFGTHQRLGLPPCSVYALFGVRCPTCGGTTAWANLVRGHWLDALAANVGATLLGILTLLGIPWLLGSVVRGRWIAWTPSSNTAARVVIALTVVTLIDWGVRLLLG